MAQVYVFSTGVVHVCDVGIKAIPVSIPAFDLAVLTVMEVNTKTCLS
jgi:hypothetical protein